MEDIKAVSVESLGESPYLKPMRLRYQQSGDGKVWDLMRCHDSVAVVIFNTDSSKFIFVQQFRPAVYLAQVRPPVSVGDRVDTETFPGGLGLTLELCAGIVDKDLSLREIASQEVEEECGYRVAPERLSKIVTFPAGVGSSVGTQTMFSVEVRDSDRVGEGGGLQEEGEMIRVVEMTVKEVEELLARERVNSPVGFLYGVSWYLQHKLNNRDQ